MVFASVTYVVVFYFGVTLTTDFCMPVISTDMTSAMENVGGGSITASSSITIGRGTPEDTVLALVNVNTCTTCKGQYLT